MASESPKVRALRKADLDTFYDEPFDASMRGITVELEGRPVAIAAVVSTRPMLAISAIGDALRKYPKTIAKTGKKFREILNLYDCAVYAVADEDEKNSPRFLQYVGFEQLEDGMFKWDK